MVAPSWYLLPILCRRNASAPVRAEITGRSFVVGHWWPGGGTQGQAGVPTTR